MLKRVLLAGLVMVAMATSALAAGVGGTVLAVQKNKVRLVTATAPESWVRKGTAVKILGVKGTIMEVKADTVSITATKPLSLKAGDAVSFERIRSTGGGC